MDCLHWQSLHSETVGDSNTRQSLLYLPWPPWVMRQEIETILSVSCHPRWPRQINSDCPCRRHYWVPFANVNTALGGFISCMFTLKPHSLNICLWLVVCTNLFINDTLFNGISSMAFHQWHFINDILSTPVFTNDILSTIFTNDIFSKIFHQ